MVHTQVDSHSVSETVKVVVKERAQTFYGSLLCVSVAKHFIPVFLIFYSFTATAGI